MKTFFFFLLSIGVVCGSSDFATGQLGGLLGSGSRVELIETDELEQLLGNREQAVEKAKRAGMEAPPAEFVLVDVRSDSEINISVIPGSITKSDFERNRKFYEGKIVIPYCAVGGRSTKFANQLSGQGVTVKNYKGSILAWVNAELPLVTVDGKPTNQVHTFHGRHSVPGKYEEVAP